MSLTHFLYGDCVKNGHSGYLGRVSTVYVKKSEKGKEVERNEHMGCCGWN